MSCAACKCESGCSSLSDEACYILTGIMETLRNTSDFRLNGLSGINLIRAFIESLLPNDPLDKKVHVFKEIMEIVGRGIDVREERLTKEGKIIRGCFTIEFTKEVKIRNGR